MEKNKEQIEGKKRSLEVYRTGPTRFKACMYAHICVSMHTDTHMQQEQSCAHKQHHCHISINCTYPLQNRIRLKAGFAEESPGGMVFPLMYLASFFKKSLKPHKTKSSASNHKFLTAKLPENSLYPQPIEPSVFVALLFSLSQLEPDLQE